MKKGTAPRGASTEEQAAQWVRSTFGRIAPRYDALNHLLSLNIDRYWRARTVRRLDETLRRPEARVLDLCCGTGDLALALQARRRSPVLASDFCHPMLLEAGRKSRPKQIQPFLFESDALRLPLRDRSLDLVTIAFGFRNLTDYRGGLRELLRVTRPGGRAAILEFSQPPNRAFAALYNFYSSHLLPRLGGWISGSPEAYSYLPESVRRFPSAEELAAEMAASGFRRVEFERMSLGIVALHIGTA